MIDANATFADTSVEETVLAFALKSVENWEDSAEQLDATAFEDRRNKALWEAAINYHSQFQGVIDEKGLEAMLDDAKVTAEKKTTYHALFATLKGRNISKSQFGLATKQLKSLQQKRKLFDLAKFIAQQLKESNPDLIKVSEAVTSQVLHLNTSQQSVFREISLISTLQERVAEYKDREAHPEKYVGIPFGIKKLDELTSGIFPEEFGLIFGRSGAGKSRTLSSIAYNMFCAGNSVMYVTIEMPQAQVGRLFDSRHFLISSGGLRHGKLSEHDKKKYFANTASLEKANGDFYVVDAPQGCSVASLMPVIRKYKARRKLDVVVLDYLNLMQASTRGSEGNESLRIGSIGKELKGLARLERVAVLSASQATRSTAEVENIDDVGTEHVSWSDLISYQCDLMVFLKKGDSASSLTKVVDAMVVKYRDGSNQKLSLGADWDKTFVGDLDEYLRLTGAVATSGATVPVSPTVHAPQQHAVSVPGGQK